MSHYEPCNLQSQKKTAFNLTSLPIFNQELETLIIQSLKLKTTKILILNFLVERDNRDMSGIMDFMKSDEVKTDDKLTKKHISPYKEDYKPYQYKEEIPVRDKPLQSQKNIKRPASGMAYGSKRKNKEGDDINDRCHEIEKENLGLKEKENLLEREITKMNTKLRRIEELIKAGKNYTDRDYASLQQELENQFGQIKDENDELKEKVRKLKVISQGLSKKDMINKKGSTTKSKAFNQQSGYKSKVQHTSTIPSHIIGGGTSSSYYQLTEELRNQLVKNEKEIIKLTGEQDKLSNTMTGNVYQDDIIKKIREKDDEIKDIRRNMDDLEMNFINKERIFKESKAYMDELLKQIREQRVNNETLKQKNLRLHIQASSVKDLEQQSKNLENERDQIEKSIRIITAEPFFKRESGQSTLKRITDLEDKLFEKEKIAKGIMETQGKKENEFKEIKNHFEQLKGERDYLHTENLKIRDKVQDNKELNQLKVYRSLFQMDPDKYGQTISDLNMKQDNVPMWASLDFLEKGQEQMDPNNIKGLKYEINKLRMENKDFAAELEKAQNLLHLQRDIEKDNHLYYEQEKNRLQLIMKSSSLKAEELARRADEKSRNIYELEKKLGLKDTSISPHLSPLKGTKGGDDPARASVNLDYLETQSEFSVMTNESEIKVDENILDFVVQDAEYYYETFKQVLDQKEMLLHQKTLITFVTVDFYVHDTETSQISEGFKPMYNTQFSFKNKIDDFFVQFIQKNTIKLDFYISKNNQAIHIGRGEVYLRELIDRETIFQENNFKTPVIQKILRIQPVGRLDQQQPIGILKYKMRIRKPLQEALRYFREKNEIQTLQAHQSMNGELDTKKRKKLITIQVQSCKDLKVKYGELAQIAPFFYYQFYTFDERYSSTKNGPNPVFNDSQTYEITFDGKIIQYLQKENLELIVFDDNAPISGIERGAKSQEEQNQDMIGIAKVPLFDLIKGATVQDRFQVKNLRGENCGIIEVKIVCMDLEGGFQSMQGIKSGLGATQYSKQWENDIIMRIAMRLARFPLDVDTMFGIFSRGQNSVSKEDFKYCALQRLNLKKEISEKEIDLLLKANPQVCDKQYIDKNDFVMLFSIPVSQAKDNIQNQEAMMYNTIQNHQTISQQMTMNKFQMDQDQFLRSTSPFKQSPKKDASGFFQFGQFGEQQAIDIMIKAKSYGNLEKVQKAIEYYAKNEKISSMDLRTVLVREGNISDLESRNIALMLEVNNQVHLDQFYQLMQKAMSYQENNSPQLAAFNALIQSNKGEVLVQKFLALDHNKDGKLNSDGMIAGLLAEEFEGRFRKEDAIEIFKIVNLGQIFYYTGYMTKLNPALKMLLANRSSTASLMRSETPNTLKNYESKSTLGDNRSQINRSLTPTEQILEDPKLKELKMKLKNFLTTQDITLKSLFKLIDTDSSQSLSLSEFLSKMRGMKVNLDDDELRYLFKILDKTSSGNITYHQFVTEFPEINISYMIKKIKDIIIGSKVPAESVFEQYCTDKKSKKMDKVDFKKFVQFYNERAELHEIDSLYQHFDQSSKGFITLEEFVNAFGREVQEQQFRIGIEDILKPFITKIKKFNVNVAFLFDKYDTTKNGKLSVLELSTALKNDMNMTLQDEEVKTIKEYFMSKYKNPDVTKNGFIKLLETKFDRTFDESQAKSSLQTLKQKISSMKINPYDALQAYDYEKTGRLTLRSFKLAIHQLKALNQYEIDNIARYFDKENEGFIAINDFEVSVKQALGKSYTNALNSSGSFSHSQSMSKFSNSGRRTQKWA